MRGTHEEPITRQTLRSLAAWNRGLVVSIFLPTLRATFHQAQNRNRLKTLIARSEPLLAARGLERREIDRLLDPARRLLPNREYWRHRLDGLAVYVSQTNVWSRRVPFRLPELVEVSDAPCIRPLLPALATEGHFYVLTISRSRVRLFRGTQAEVHELDLAAQGIPSSLSDAMRFDDFARQMQSHATGRSEPRLQTHSQSSARAGRHVWHGHGSGDEQIKEQMGRYFRAVDEGVCTLLSGERAPLILAAVDYEQNLYRSMSKYPHIALDGIAGNPDRRLYKNLATAWPIALRSLRAPVVEARVAYVEASSAGAASDELGEVLRAAHQGRISVLLLRSGAEQWGTYDPETAQLNTYPDAPASHSDLLDLAVRQTLLHDGDAYLVDAAEMPSPGTVAAVFRF